MRTRIEIRGRILLSAAVLVTLAAPLVFGLASGAAGQASSQAAAQPTPAFEIISIKPVDPNRREPIGMFTYPGGKLIITSYSLKMLIHEAYGVNDDQISGGPGWTGDEKYDIEAVPAESSEAHKFSPPTPKTAPSPEMLLMLRNLLADRFQLKLRTETKTGSGYALVVGTHGPKLSQTKKPEAYRVVGDGRTDKPELPDYIFGENASMQLLAANLARHFRCPVLDQTGIKGDYDFRFDYAANDTELDSGPSLFSAIQEQLGLKLTSIKAPIEILVIDHAEKPSPN